MKKLSLFTIAWPIFVESALHMFLRTIDTFMLSKVGDDAVAAVGVANLYPFTRRIRSGGSFVSQAKIY